MGVGEWLQPRHHDRRWCPHRRCRGLLDGGRGGFAFFAEVEELDTWHVSGLQGTHSTDYRVDNAHVPLERIVSMDRRSLVVDTPLYRFSTSGALALGVAMTMVGLAERATEELSLLADKIPQGSSKGLAHCAPVQAELARSVAAVRGARAYVADEVGRSWDEVASSGRVTNARLPFGWHQTQQPWPHSAQSTGATRPPGEKPSTADRRSSESSGTFMLRRNTQWSLRGCLRRSADSSSASKPIPAGSSLRASRVVHPGRSCHWRYGAGCRHESTAREP